MPAERKTLGKPRRSGVVVIAASATDARGARSGQAQERSNRAMLDLMREIGYAQPALVAEFFDLR